MTKREFEITNQEELKEILDQSLVLHLGMCDGDQPYVLPMNYGYVWEENQLVIYLHGATNGYKYEVMKKNPKVSFSMECGVTPFEGKTACQYGMAYSCIMGKGIATLVENVEEKEKALTLLMEAQTGKHFEFNEKLVSVVNVIRLDVKEFSGKKRPVPAAIQEGMFGKVNAQKQ